LIEGRDMEFKYIYLGVILAIVGTWLSSFAMGTITFSFAFIILRIGDILFIFGIVLMNHGRNKTRGYR